MIKEGASAPAFSLASDKGKTVSLSDFSGRKVVLYFYPKDDTPGCTKEACSFRDSNELFIEKGAAVIGISADDSLSHTRFREKYGLPFYLLSDPDHSIMERYGVWSGRVMRTTFIIDEKGIVAKVFENVNPENHAGDVLKYL